MTAHIETASAAPRRSIAARVFDWLAGSGPGGYAVDKDLAEIQAMYLQSSAGVPVWILPHNLASFR